MICWLDEKYALSGQVVVGRDCLVRLVGIGCGFVWSGCSYQGLDVVLSGQVVVGRDWVCYCLVRLWLIGIGCGIVWSGCSW